MDSKSLGELGENMACDYLRKKGYKILDRNFKMKMSSGPIFGEIDIIAKPRRNIFDILRGKKDKAIHFVEVKTISQNNNFEPQDKVDFQKQRKLIKMAQIWLSKNKISLDSKWQIDIIGISNGPDAENPKIRHFENAISDLTP